MKIAASLLSFSVLAFPAVSLAQTQVDPKYEIHDRNRPVPPVIDAGTASTQEAAGRAPSDATVLFDGKDLSKWQHTNATAPKEKGENEYFKSLTKLVNLYT